MIVASQAQQVPRPFRHPGKQILTLLKPCTPMTLVDAVNAAVPCSRETRIRITAPLPEASESGAVRDSDGVGARALGGHWDPADMRWKLPKAVTSHAAQKPTEAMSPSSVLAAVRFGTSQSGPRA